MISAWMSLSDLDIQTWVVTPGPVKEKNESGAGKESKVVGEQNWKSVQLFIPLPNLGNSRLILGFILVETLTLRIP